MEQQTTHRAYFFWPSWLEVRLLIPVPSLGPGFSLQAVGAWNREETPRSRRIYPSPSAFSLAEGGCDAHPGVSAHHPALLNLCC